jgi:hypothetical protein
MLYKIKPIKLFLIISLVCFNLFSCKNRNTETVVETKAEGIYDSAEFQDFYQKFSTDSAFQMEHTVFPLEGMRSLQDSLDIPDPNFRWTQDNWRLHKPYDDMNGTYSREFVDFAGIVVEKISDTSGQYTMERRFSKLSSGWHLIYYREMGRY